LVAPAEKRRIDNARRSMRSLGLKAASRVRMKCFRLVDPKAIERAGVSGDGAGEVSTAFFGPERMDAALGLIFRAASQDHVHPLCLRRPDAKMRPTVADQFRPDRVASLDSCLFHPIASTSTAASV